MGSGIDLDALVVRRGVCYDLRLPAGKITTVIGPNGAGKTSLIQLIAGILAPDKGSVRIHDVEFATPSYVRPAHRRRCGYLEQRTLLFPHLNVLENVAFGPRSRGASRASAHRRAYDELEAVGLADFAERAVTDLSGGQAQRVALARALAIDPEVVLLDEPFSALDASIVPEQRRVLRQRLAGITTVLATHDFLDVALLADYVVELAAGEVVRATEVEEAIQRPTTQFMAGLAGVNLVNGTLIEMSTLAIGQGLSVTGQGVNILDGVAGQAVFPSTAVAVSLVPSPGALPATVKAIEDYGVTQRVISVVADHQISATLSPQAFRRLSLSVGMQVWLALDQSLVQLSSV